MYASPAIVESEFNWFSYQIMQSKYGRSVNKIIDGTQEAQNWAPLLQSYT
jgi:hypothetical protein